MTSKMTAKGAVAAIALAATTCATRGEIVLLGQFTPGLGTPVGCGFDHTTSTIWVYASFGSTISQYTIAGALVTSVPRPGEAANDVDIEIAPEPLMLGSVAVPEGTVIFINGESGAADLYAVNPVTGAVISSLTTSFGVSHVVGGAYHPTRNTFFLVQDLVPGGANANLIAEINPISGAVVNSFQISGVYSVNFGDLEVNAQTGNLLVVSSNETTIGEFTPSGAFVQERALPAGVTSLSGIGMDDATGQAWVSGTGGTVWNIDGLEATAVPGDITGNGVVDVDDLLAVINAWGACEKPCPPSCAADIAPEGGNCVVDVDDLLMVINNWG